MSKRTVTDDIPFLWWKEYKKTQDVNIRNRLVEHYLFIVKYNAQRMWAGLPDGVELDDLISEGIFGLIDAIKDFDLSRGIKFETYCVLRIRGAMLDYLRGRDWVPRLVRSSYTRYQKVVTALSNGNGEIHVFPTAEQVARYHDISIDEAQSVIAEASKPIIRMSRIQEETREDMEDSGLEGRHHIGYNLIPDPKALTPFEIVSEGDYFTELISCLPAQMQFILILYYQEDRTMKSIGEFLDLSESRVSQIHDQALQRIKDAVAVP